MGVTFHWIGGETSLDEWQQLEFACRLIIAWKCGYITGPLYTSGGDRRSFQHMYRICNTGILLLIIFRQFIKWQRVLSSLYGYTFQRTPGQKWRPFVLSPPDNRAFFVESLRQITNIYFPYKKVPSWQSGNTTGHLAERWDKVNSRVKMIILWRQLIQGLIICISELLMHRLARLFSVN